MEKFIWQVYCQFIGDSFSIGHLIEFLIEAEYFHLNRIVYSYFNHGFDGGVIFLGESRLKLNVYSALWHLISKNFSYGVFVKYIIVCSGMLNFEH